MPINTDLESLYYEDKEQRESAKTPKQVELLESITRKRVIRVKEMIPFIDDSEIWNCHYIAYILHHSNQVQDYKLAHQYATKAVEMGSSAAKWLYAVTLDRWLVFQGKKQKFGTQYEIKKGNKHYFPSDGTVSDKERSSFGIKT